MDDVTKLQLPGDELKLESGSRKAKLTAEESQKYQALYGVKERALYRWIDKGVEGNDPCPLHDPVALMSWWPRHNTWRVPPEIEAAAVEARNQQAASSAQGVAPAQSAGVVSSPSEADSSSITGSGPAQATTASQAPKLAASKIDLESYDPEEGDRLRELKQIQAGRFNDLKTRLKLGEDCSVLETKYLKLCETVDKMETRITERLKKRGQYILRDEVLRDLATNAEMLRQTVESMERRVLELCSFLSPEHRLLVGEAIRRARESEALLFARLPSLTSDDISRELHATS